MSKHDAPGCGCLAIVGLIFFPFMVLSEILKRTK